MFSLKTKYAVYGAAIAIALLLGCAAITLVTTDGQTTLTFGNMFVDALLSDFLKLITYFAVIMMLISSVFITIYLRIVFQEERR